MQSHWEVTQRFDDRDEVGIARGQIRPMPAQQRNALGD
jgi:hypothetical protein